MRKYAVALFAVLLTASPASAAPFVQFIHPPQEFKLREGRSLGVRVNVEARSEALKEWRLLLSGGGRPEPLELVRDEGEVHGQVVETVKAEDLTLGEVYQLTLEAEDEAGATSSVQVTFRVPDPQYAIIPIDTGDLSVTTSKDSASTGAADGRPSDGGRPDRSLLLDTRDRLPAHSRVSGWSELRAASGRGWQALLLSRAVLRRGSSTVVQSDLSRRTMDRSVEVPRTDTQLFSVSRDGRWVAFQSVYDLDPSVGNPERQNEYYVYDFETQEVHQLTSSPDAIVKIADPNRCPQIIGTTPLISGDGSRVVIVTGSTLGLTARDPNVGCYVFVYDVPNASWRFVTGLPKGPRVRCTRA